MTDTDIRAVLDEKVRAYTGEALEREGIVTGWVLCVASTRFDDDGDACYAYDYSCGPDTDMIRAVGLVHLCHEQILDHITNGFPRPDDD